MTKKIKVSKEAKEFGIIDEVIVNRTDSKILNKKE